MAESVKLRHPDTGEELTRSKTAAPFFVNQGYVVVDKRGNVSASATSALQKGSN